MPGALRGRLAVFSGLLALCIVIWAPSAPFAAHKHHKRHKQEAPARPGQAAFVPSNCINSAFQPIKIVVTCGDGSSILEALTWSSWTDSGALGTGTFAYKNCPPDVALAFCRTYDRPQATVSAYRVRFCRRVKKNHFTRVYISAPTAVEPDLRSFVVRFPCRMVLH